MKTIFRQTVPVCFLLLLVLFQPAVSEAQGKKKAPVRKYLVKTSMIILAAKKELKKGEHFTGDFSKAVAHQRYAIKLLGKKKLDDALSHSQFARAYAFKTIKANSPEASLLAEWENSQEENNLLEQQELPSEDELIRELEEELGDIIYDDQSLLEDSLEDLDLDDLIDD